MTRINASSAASDSRNAGFWYSADGQSSIDMTGATAAEAVSELLAQCTTDAQRADILAGEIEVAE